MSPGLDSQIGPVKRTRGEKVCAFIETYLYVPQGFLAGKKMKLEPFQRKFITDLYDNPYGTRRAYLSIARKNGKGLALDTPIPTPTGWKAMGMLAVGDEVFDENGQPCRVDFVSPVHIGLKCWRLTFSDGTQIVADEQHRWLTRQAGKRQAKVVTTPEIADSVRHPRPDGGIEFNHSIAVAKTLQMADTELPLDPYLLGCWLGDGKSNSAEIYCGEADLEHMQRAVGDGLSCEPMVRRDRTCWAIRLSGGRSGAKAGKFQAGLRRLGLLNAKHIPHQYLWAGTEQRRALLQGLMDTDGTISPTGKSGAMACSFSACNPLLAHQFATLARSLGLKVRPRERDAKIEGRVVGAVHEIQFTAWREDAVFRLPRKLDRLPPRPGTARRSGTLKIVACEPVDSVPTRCIKVSSPSSLFLAGPGMTPTHNTGLIAGILLAHIAGPEARLNAQIVSGAQSRDQAALVFELAAQMVQMSPELGRLVRIVPSGKRLIGLARNVTYKALSAEGKTAHGLSPVLAILDEVGQVRGPVDGFVSAIETSQGAYTDPLLIAISTQAATDNDLFSTWIDAQKNAPDPRVVSHVYTAPEDCELDDRAAWMMANPALGKFKAMQDLEAGARQAREMPANESTFRNLSLNQRVEAFSPFVSRSVWMQNAAVPAPLDGQKVYGGLDLSAVHDLTALVLATEAGDVHSTFWLPKEGLLEKARKDHVPWDVWEKDGLLQTSPGKAIEYRFVAEHLRGVFDRCDVQQIGFDRYNMRFLKPWLVDAGFTDKELEKFVEFGQGTASMTPALRELEVRLLNGSLKHGDHKILSMCAANATTAGDSGARKFVKFKDTRRIDGMVALAMAIGVMPTIAEPKKKYQLLWLGGAPKGGRNA